MHLLSRRGPWSLVASLSGRTRDILRGLSSGRPDLQESQEQRRKSRGFFSAYLAPL
jgi:hypothetical protein